MDMSQFNKDIEFSDLANFDTDSVHQLVDKYNSTFSELIDKHAPERHSIITIRPHANWYTDVITKAKEERRKLEVLEI